MTALKNQIFNYGIGHQKTLSGKRYNISVIFNIACLQQ